jgi:hypothetical protein
MTTRLADYFVFYGKISRTAFVLQKSQKALRLIFRQRTKQATIADQCSLRPIPGACH